MPKPPLPKNQVKDTYAKIRMTEKEYKFLLKKAMKENKTFSQFVRDAIASYLRGNTEEWPPIF